MTYTLNYIGNYSHSVSSNREEGREGAREKVRRTQRGRQFKSSNLLEQKIVTQKVVEAHPAANSQQLIQQHILNIGFLLL